MQLIRKYGALLLASTLIVPFVLQTIHIIHFHNHADEVHHIEHPAPEMFSSPDELACPICDYQFASYCEITNNSFQNFLVVLDYCFIANTNKVCKSFPGYNISLRAPPGNS